MEGVNKLGLNHAAIDCTDLELAFDFFNNTLGFQTYWDKSQDWGMVSMGITTLSFVRVPEMPKKKASDGVHYPHLGITVETMDDVDRAFEQLKSKGVKIFEDKPKLHRDESYGFYFHDPFGNLFELIYIKF